MSNKNICPRPNCGARLKRVFNNNNTSGKRYCPNCKITYNINDKFGLYWFISERVSERNRRSDNLINELIALGNYSKVVYDNRKPNEPPSVNNYFVACSDCGSPDLATSGNETYLCLQCGYLEIDAPPPPASDNGGDE